jgi:hypothetical protein
MRVPGSARVSCSALVSRPRLPFGAGLPTPPKPPTRRSPLLIATPKLEASGRGRARSRDRDTTGDEGNDEG